MGTPTVDAFARSTPTSVGQFRRWQAGDPVAGQSWSRQVSRDDLEPTSYDPPSVDIDADAEDMRRRAREWVNRTVPMQHFEDEVDSPVVLPSKKVSAFDV